MSWTSRLENPMARLRRSWKPPSPVTRTASVVAQPMVHAPVAGAILVLLVVEGALSSYNSYLLVVTLVYIIASLGLNIPLGYLGQLSLGQGAALGLGAYVAAALSTHDGWPVIATLPVTFLFGAALGAVMAAPSARLTQIGIGMLTLGYTLVLSDLILALPGVTGGGEGITGITAPLLPGGANLGQVGIGIVVIVVFVAVYLVHWLYRVSHAGRASLALRGNVVGAAALGVSRQWFSVIGYAVGTGMGAVAGGLFAYVQQALAPDSFGISLSVLFLLMVVFGGAGTRFGPVIGGAIIGLLPILLASHASLSQYIYGGLLIVLMRLLPRGIVFVRGARVPERQRWTGLVSDEAVHPAAEDQINRGEGLVIRDVSRHFGGVYAVQDVSLDVKRGEVLAIVGANGSGKTTLLNLVSGYYAPHAGTVSLAGQQLAGHAPFRTARQGVSRTFQVPQLFPDLTVDEHLALARWYARDELGAEQEVARRFLDTVGVSGDRLHREARRFSHGEQRFVEICLAVIRAPRLILMDEPAAGLSHREIQTLAELVRAVSALGISVVVVEHHHDFVRDVADRILVMHLGRSVWCGPVAEFGESTEVRDTYLGVTG